MSETELAFTPATDLAEMIRLKKISPVELVDLYASRIEQINPKLNAYLTLTIDQARDQAKVAEAAVNGDDLPPFHGVPISIKDLNDTAGVRTTHGTAAFSDRIPDADEEVVSRIKRAGFIMLGKTNTPEFGTTPWTEPIAYGPARNPWDTERTPGGSSGGAAAALAAGLCPISQGSDGGGSIRIPSSVCGLFGIKPSRGRVSSAPGAQSFLSQDGPIARTVADAAALLDAMAGYAAGDAWYAPPPERPFAEEAGRPPGRLRIAWSHDAEMDTVVAPANQRAVEDTASLLESLGHEVVAQKPHTWPPELINDFLITWCVRTDAYLPMAPLETLEPLNRALIEVGRGYNAPQYERAQRAIQVNSRKLVEFFNDVDVVMTPTVAIPPPRIGEYHDPDNPLLEFIAAGNFVPFTPAWNTTGQPAVSIPLHSDENGLPVGVQLVGRPGAEATLIRLSAQLEEGLPWADRRPSVS
jgi:amidase